MLQTPVHMPNLQDYDLSSFQLVAYGAAALPMEVNMGFESAICNGYLKRSKR